MINNIEPYITNENIYLITNFGVLPFWLMLLTMPNHKLTGIFVQSIIAPFLLAVAYVFIGYKIYLDENILNGFNLYLGLENLYTIFSDESFLLIFWIHFLSISLFIGSWIVRDSSKYFIPRIITFISLILTYFTGPVGLVFYWMFRIFFSRKIGFND